MVYKYKKYKSLEDFIKNSPKTSYDENYTIIHKCKGLDIKTSIFNNNCFQCLFCLNSQEQIQKFLKYVENDNYFYESMEKTFNLAPIKSPMAMHGLSHKYKSLDSFTSVEETSNIQPWAAGILYNSSSKPCRIGMEIPVLNNKYDRNGRLDIGLITDNGFIAIESKISLDDALKDERFVEQYVKYTEEIKKYTNNFVYLTLLGGKETDLYPITNQYCSGLIGNKTKRFYKMIIDNNIKFISATALWCLCVNNMANKNNYCDKNLQDIFSDNSCIGLVSAGKIVKKNNDIIIEKI